VILRDLLLRGRGADIGTRAPQWLVQCCGAVLGAAVCWQGELLGLWEIAGVPLWTVLLTTTIAGAIFAHSLAGGLLWLVNGLMLTVLLVVMFTPIVPRLAGSVVRADRPGSAPLDAVLVLSGSMTDDGLLKGQGLDRLLTGLAMGQQRRIPELGLSVVTEARNGRLVSTEADQRALVALLGGGVPPRFIRNVANSRDEALGFAALARTHGWRRVLVVTSPMHTHRACAAMEAAGLTIECHPATGRVYPVGTMAGSENRRDVFQDLLYETVATALYRWRGWIP
jgi:hypothetical protein